MIDIRLAVEFTCGQNTRRGFLALLLLSQRCWSLGALRLGDT
jgi:hypothetical protein